MTSQSNFPPVREEQLTAKRLEADLGSLAEYQRVSQYRRLYVK